MFEQHRMYGQRGTDGSNRLGFDRTDVNGGKHVIRFKKTEPELLDGIEGAGSIDWEGLKLEIKEMLDDSKRKINEYVPIITEDDGDDFDLLGETQEEESVDDDAWYK